MDWLVLLIVVASLAMGFYLLSYGGQLKSLWSEPVLRYPVVIFESDDWGPAEDFEAERLHRIARVLAAYRDSKGRHPVMTLGVVLSVPDSDQIAAGGFTRYHALRLDQPRFRAVREAMAEGADKGVFAAQLHGMAHYLPQTILKAAAGSPEVKSWLSQGRIADPWQLPSPLQSRWIDGTRLPSGHLDPEEVKQEAVEEVRAFKAVFGISPQVAVPPTFIWTHQVEMGWASEGVRYLVTPGRHYEGRDAQGRPVAVEGNIRNGQRSQVAPIRYLVRDAYFEPKFGHLAEEAERAVATRTRLGRPTLFETHRFNFNGPEDECDKAIKALDEALGLILRAHPDIRFLTSAELGGIFEKRDPDWVESRLVERIRYLQTRARLELPLIRRLLPISV